MQLNVGSGSWLSSMFPYCLEYANTLHKGITMLHEIQFYKPTSDSQKWLHKVQGFRDTIFFFFFFVWIISVTMQLCCFTYPSDKDTTMVIKRCTFTQMLFYQNTEVPLSMFYGVMWSFYLISCCSKRFIF